MTAPSKCACAQCGNHIEFPSENAGDIVQCPHCGNQTPLTSSETFRPPGEPLSAADIGQAFVGTFQRAPISWLYRLGVLLVSAVVILLPLLYLAIIALAIYGLYHYAVSGWGLGVIRYNTSGSGFIRFRSVFPRQLVPMLFLYFGPLFIGAVMVFFMIKPLFARRSSKMQGLEITPELQPALFAFIAKIASIVGAPMPRRIELDCRLNSAADFRAGLRNFLGNDLVLRIGLPLVAGLDLREFAGVMAHELAHFSQSSGLRLAFVIRAVNGWFDRVAHERDSVDLYLEGYRDDTTNAWISFTANVALVGRDLVRLLLKLFLFVGRGLGGFLLRQMEYDADNCQIKLAGSASFEATMQRLVTLRAAIVKAEKESRVTWQLSRRLPDNFPAYMLLHESAAAKTPPAEKTETGIFSAHPSDAERICRAREANQPGIFHLEVPATALFSHFELTAREVTYFHYVEILGLILESSNLRPVEALAAPNERSAPVA